MTRAAFAEGYMIGQLQFGHSVAAVDDGRGEPPGAGGRDRFNSATASPPWMTPSHTGKRRPSRKASIRPQRRRRG